MRASKVEQCKNPHATAGDTGDAGLIPGSGRSPGVRNGSTLQYSCLENSMDRGAWRTTVHEVTEWDTTGQLSTQQEWGHARGPLIHLWNLSRLTENLCLPSYSCLPWCLLSAFGFISCLPISFQHVGFAGHLCSVLPALILTPSISYYFRVYLLIFHNDLIPITMITAPSLDLRPVFPPLLS